MGGAPGNWMRGRDAYYVEHDMVEGSATVMADRKVRYRYYGLHLCRHRSCPQLREVASRRVAAVHCIIRNK